MLSRRVAFSLSALALLALTVGVKAAVSDFRYAPDFARFNAETSAALKTQGFAVLIEPHVGDEDIIRASRGDCRLAVRGELRDDFATMFKRQTAGTGATSYFYRGRHDERFPSSAFETSGYADRVLQRLGFDRPIDVPLATAASSGCPLTNIDFGPLLMHQRP